jgi:hypothetical protein
LKGAFGGFGDSYDLLEYEPTVTDDVQVSCSPFVSSDAFHGPSLERFMFRIIVGLVAPKEWGCPPQQFPLLESGRLDEQHATPASDYRVTSSSTVEVEPYLLCRMGAGNWVRHKGIPEVVERR